MPGKVFENVSLLLKPYYTEQMIAFAKNERKKNLGVLELPSILRWCRPVKLFTKLKIQPINQLKA